ncbi:MAG: hypothetical protein V1745_01335 [Patescibacteria group bacterium]
MEGGRSFGSVGNIGSAVSDDVAIVPIRNYTFSMYARVADADQGDGAFTVQLRLKDANGDAVASGPYFRSLPSCTKNQGNLVGFDDEASSVEWLRYQCTFVANEGAVLANAEVSGSNVLVDAIQLEETEAATSFVDGLASGLTERHLKIAPEELNCTGREGDRPSCEAFAQMCSQGDVGCQGYRDVDIPTAPEIPASLSATDFCPASCVGYAEYRKQPSTFDLGRNADSRLDDPEDEISSTFVPAYAQSCSIQDVGCEEFTNVETAAAGGEGKAFFNYVRACEKPGDETATYFTWEGSDTTGYQLRTWSLIKAAPNATAPKIVQKAGPDGILKEPSACNDYTWNLAVDPDCRQIYDEAGEVFYAYFSQTVVSSPSCTDFRKNKSDAADCEKTGGSFTPATGECLYRVLPSESSICPATSAGCRAYIGTTGRNTSIVLEEDFKATTGTTPFSAETNVEVSLSNESILVGDQSLKITGNGTLSIATTFASYPNQYYRVSFWAKTTQPSLGTPATLTVDGKDVGSIAMETDWRRYEFGPFAANTDTPTSTISWRNLPNATYLDTLRIERLNDVTFVVKDSWTIPAECERTPEGLPQPQAMVGCRAYEDRDGATVTVRRFGRLCSEKAIGCKGFVDTRNSESPYAQTFDILGTETNAKTTDESKAWEDKYIGSWQTTRPADRYVYLIDESRAQCDATEASCRMFGKPRLEQDTLEPTSTNDAYETVYLIDDITSYMTADGEPNLLCRKDELFCDEFKSGKTVAYFRNPLTHVCEWKDKVLLKKNVDKGIPGDGEYTGWFRKGTDTPCYPKVLSSGNTYLIQNSGDPGYTGWVGLCPIEQSECTEFRDPNDHGDPIHPTGKPYFFIKNQRVDLKSCNGQVDLLGGCVLFRDMSDVRLRYSTNATYAKSHSEDDTPQAPIDCTTDPDNEFCKTAKFCTDVHKVSCNNLGCEEPLPSNCVQPSEECTDDPNGEACRKALEVDGCTGPGAVKKLQYAACQTDADCSVSATNMENWTSGYRVSGTCTMQNDANVVMKVRLDRDCAKWLGCATGETVFDPVQQKYTDLCTELAMCDVSKGANAGSFCANYIDRSKEPILKTGAFFTRDLYTTRKTGFGEVDYSGYVIPDQFQAADLQNRKVAYELFTKEPSIANKFATDYRLVAAVPETTGLITFPAEVEVPVDELYPNLYICSHKVTGRTGYFMPEGNAGKRFCYFPLDALTERSADISASTESSATDPRSIQALSDVFRQSVDPKYDISLTRSFPPAECKANPEADSPFPGLYVKEWDYTKEPFTPATIAEGYTNANLCEWGEDCSCSYRKVKYGGTVTRYYSPFGKSPVGGICNGGTKDGESCVPPVETKKDGSAADTSDPGCPGGGRCLDISDVVLVRGQFGQCLQRDMSRTVAGDQGRHPCLVWNPNPILSGTYDASHYQPKAGYFPPVNAGEYYCLSYANPPFENIWSALSHTKWDDPRSRDGDGGSQFFILPGKLSKFNFDTGYIAGRCSNDDTLDDVCNSGQETDCTCHDGESGIEAENRDYFEMFRAADGGNQDIGEMIKVASCDIPAMGPECFQSTPPDCSIPGSGCDIEDCRADPMDNECERLWRFTNLGQDINGITPAGGVQADRCMRASTQPETDATNGPPGSGYAGDGIGPWDNAPDADYSMGRWIMTGRGAGRTYQEYFIPVKPSGVTAWMYPNAASMTNLEEADVRKTIMRERNFASFSFFPVANPAAAACSLPTEYVDGVNVTNWSDPTEVANASNAVIQKFSADFDGVLDRSKEAILVDKTGKPRKEACSGIIKTGTNPPLGEDLEGVFGESDDRCYYKYWETDYRMDGTSKFEWLDAVAGESFVERSDQVYAHERTCSKSGFAIRAMFENASKDQNNIEESEVTEDQLTGPWNFVGFWVTACWVGHDGESSLYLALKVKHADVCREIGQVIAPYSRESAAFADRVWARGSFSIPILGYSYVTNYTPFGSALVNDIPDDTPLFQTGQPVSDYSVLSPPTFLGSGATMVTNRISPLQRWAHLTNVFARVYRVYKYFDTGVPIKGYACFGGMNDGVACLEPGSDRNDKLNDLTCASRGTCDTARTDMTFKNAVWKCNGLSGVNAGLECGGNGAVKSFDPVCHNAAMKRNATTGILEPQYSSCQLRAGWIKCPNGLYAKPGEITEQEDGHAAFGCGENGSISVSLKKAHETYNAFGCAGDAVLPGAGCSSPNDTASKDCPKKVIGLTCIGDDFGPMNGHCSGGYENARCMQASDCVFTVSQWWGAYDDGSVSDHPDIPGDDRQAWATNYRADGSRKTAQDEWQALPFATEGDMSQAPGTMGRIARSVKNFYPTIGLVPWPFTSHLTYGSIAYLPGQNLQKNWPSPHLFSQKTGDLYNAVVPALCEGAVGASMDEQGFWGPNYPNQDNLPTERESKDIIFDAGFYGRANQSQYALQAGQCEGGPNDGQLCVNSSDAAGWEHPNTCAPPTNVGSGSCESVTASVAASGEQTPVPACTYDNPTGDAFSKDPDKDNNACTRSSGYAPRRDLCGNTADNEKCLIGYDLTTGMKQESLNQVISPAPTDVTAGFHRPSFLGFEEANPYDEQHIATYPPRPPTIAAPDLSRTCESPGQCRISSVNAFTLEEQSAGPVVFSGGKAQVTMKFYGWASHDQTPLKAVIVDWGDGTITKIEDARLKNRKPFCSTSRECELVSGLTCGTDADCPPGGGRCSERGTCSQNPSKSCFRDSECGTAGKCDFREFFGNSVDACEPGYFEFTHAYSCNPSTKMPSCPSKLCSRNTAINEVVNNIVEGCNNDGDCGSGDKCIEGLAPASVEGQVGGGCFDDQKTACTYTPRVMLVDSWNWCTGECRAGPMVGNEPTDDPNSIVKHIFGGCWDGTETMKNTDIKFRIMETKANECNISLDPLAFDPIPAVSIKKASNIRPWIVYQGAVQLGSYR